MGKAPRTDEEIAKALMHDIRLNVGGKKIWADYDEKYVLERILRAIREAKGQ